MKQISLSNIYLHVPDERIPYADLRSYLKEIVYGSYSDGDIKLRLFQLLNSDIFMRD